MPKLLMLTAKEKRERLGSALRVVRLHSHRTLGEMARGLSWNMTAVSNVERGISDISREEFRLWMKICSEKTPPSVRRRA